jgi:hypothetical protein
MASRSSRPRSGSGHDPAVLARLLQDDACLPAPDELVVAAADHLAALGLVDIHRSEFVLCANPRDDDFPPPQRECQGRIWVLEGRDDDRCPECDRLVFPHGPPKRRYLAFQVRVRADGVMGYLAGQAAAVGEHSAPAPGVLRFRAEPDDVLICVAELCGDAQYLRLDTAAMRPTVLVTLEPAGLGRVLLEDWLLRTTLADVVAGKVSLPALLRRAVAQGPARNRTSASLPIYSAGARPVTPKPLHASRSLPRLELEVTADEARVQGIVVADRRADIQLPIMQILWDQLRLWLMAGCSKEFEPLRLEKIADELEERTEGERPDPETVRKAINRLQAKIERLLKRRLGLPVGRTVIETVRWRGVGAGYGYRFNLNKVSLVLASGGRRVSVGKK